MKKDRYSHARDGASRLLEIFCANCGTHICLYQKDGRGQLKRLYLDRISGGTLKAEAIFCSHCNKQLGVLINYAKENRPAYRLLPGSIRKTLAKQ